MTEWQPGPFEPQHVEDFIVRVPHPTEEAPLGEVLPGQTVEYSLFDYTGSLQHDLGESAVAAMVDGVQPWADFALLEALDQPIFRDNPVKVLNGEGLLVEGNGFEVRQPMYPQDAVESFKDAHPEVKLPAQDVAYQYELVYDEHGEPRLLSTREHEQLGVWYRGHFEPFATHLNWLHPVIVAQQKLRRS